MIVAKAGVVVFTVKGRMILEALIWIKELLFSSMIVELLKYIITETAVFNFVTKFPDRLESRLTCFLWIQRVKDFVWVFGCEGYEVILWIFMRVVFRSHLPNHSRILRIVRTQQAQVIGDIRRLSLRNISVSPILRTFLVDGNQGICNWFHFEPISLWVDYLYMRFVGIWVKLFLKCYSLEVKSWCIFLDQRHFIPYEGCKFIVISSILNTTLFKYSRIMVWCMLQLSIGVVLVMYIRQTRHSWIHFLLSHTW